jgi:hypothetical protein
MFCRCGIQLALRRDRSRERLFRLLHRIVLWCCKVDVRRRSGESLGVAFVVAEAAIKRDLPPPPIPLGLQVQVWPLYLRMWRCSGSIKITTSTKHIHVRCTKLVCKCCVSLCSHQHRKVRAFNILGTVDTDSILLH